MSAPLDGPCVNWVTATEMELAPDFNPDKLIEPTILDEAAEIASYILYELSGRQYTGLCEKTVRPTLSGNWNSLLGFEWSSIWGTCNCGASLYTTCSCANLSEIELGAYPLESITQVKIDGVVFGASNYRIDNYKTLVRLDGMTWPTNQDLESDSTDVDTFEVTFKYGRAIPTIAKNAARYLAMELAKGYSNQKCKLPERIQTITRQGITVGFADTFEFFEHRKTGIYAVDLFLIAVNPKGRRGTAGVLSPDVGAQTRRVNT